ncbi:hypothetical protein RND81_13G036300 [Saponaria officinalis]|uniref:mitogen-activated protein kinase kinase kinase n=1 Tax=Saponaria officinalis TaxID=3572 RepID=A0AAW1GX60_SAPOF
MPSWLVKPSSKEVKQKKTKRNFFDAIHRKFKSRSEDKTANKSGVANKFTNDIRSEKEFTSSVSFSPSLEVSRCHSFVDNVHAQPLPLPESDTKTSVGMPVSPDGWGELGTGSVSSDSSVDTNDQPDSRLFSPQASDYESGNVTAMNSPSRLRDRSPLSARRLLKDQPKPVNLTSNDHKLRRNGPLRSNVTQLQIPPHAGFVGVSDSSKPSPSRSPMGTCRQEQVKKFGVYVRRAYSDMNSVGYRHCCSPGSGQNSIGDTSIVWPQNRCNTECSPILSPTMTSPRCRSLIPSGHVIPSHYRAGERPDNRTPQSHILPLPPVSVTNSFSKNSGRGESPISLVSRWKKGRLIGSGTFGHVYLGFDSETGEMCAMKEVTLFSDDPKSKECAQQLGQEITLLSRLRHPNIVRYIGSETVDDKLYIFLEYVSGGSIHKLLKDYGKFGESAIRSFTRQILSGLAYLHARNTVHRDIKGANILVDPSGRVKLADFGMAKHITAHSGPLSFKGSPYWMAPEVIRNSNGSSLAVDIWSLGCTVIEMATAKPPWSQYEGVGNSKEIPTVPDRLSKEGRDFVCKCLQRSPFDRPTAAQLLDHPFVKDVIPSGRCLLNSEPSQPLPEDAVASKYTTGSGHIKKVAGLDLEGVAAQLSTGFKIGSCSSDPCISKHLSCPVSPVGSPLRCSQTTPQRRSPFISNLQSTFSSSTSYNGCSRRRHHQSKFDSRERIKGQSHQKSLHTSSNHLYHQSKQKPSTLSDLR